MAFHPIPKDLRRDHHSFGFLLHGGDGWQRLMAKDGIGSQDTGFTMPKAVQGDLTTGFANFVHAHHT